MSPRPQYRTHEAPRSENNLAERNFYVRWGFLAHSPAKVDGAATQATLDARLDRAFVVSEQTLDKFKLGSYLLANGWSAQGSVYRLEVPKTTVGYYSARVEMAEADPEVDLFHAIDTAGELPHRLGLVPLIHRYQKGLGETLDMLEIAEGISS